MKVITYGLQLKNVIICGINVTVDICDESLSIDPVLATTLYKNVLDCSTGAISVLRWNRPKYCASFVVHKTYFYPMMVLYGMLRCLLHNAKSITSWVRKHLTCDVIFDAVLGVAIF